MDYRTAPPDAPLLVVSSQVTALDRATGAERWVYHFGGGHARRFVVDVDRLFVYDTAAKIHCIDIGTGAALGVVVLEMALPNAMLLDGDRLYVCGDNEVAALDRDGRLLWKVRIALNRATSLGGLAIPGGGAIQPDYAT